MLQASKSRVSPNDCPAWTVTTSTIVRVEVPEELS
jgi:hypothetical protein